MTIKNLSYRLFLCFQFLIFAGESSAQLTGAFRKEVIDGVEGSCFRTQRQGSPNAALSDAVLKQYCRCTATYLADLLNEPLVRDIEAGRAKPNPVWNQAAADYCRINYKKY
jgi:hypothetical protein